MSRLLRRTLIGVVFGVVVYIVWLLVSDAREVADSLQGFAWSAVAWALLASSLNYLLRFWKWELALGWLGVRAGSGGLHAPTELKLGRSLEIYLAGLSMSVTPGKVGEVLRSVLLKASNEVPFTRTAPIVVADRLSDLIALIVLALIGISEFAEFLPYVIAALVLVVAGVVVLGSPKLFGGILNVCAKLPVIGGLAQRAHGLIDSAAVLLELRYITVLSAISVVGWGLECVGYWVILNAFPGVEAGLPLCVFLWSATTLIGALSFLPGGLGATEGSLGVLVARFAVGVSGSIAMASTLLIRLCTLWYGELVGAIALVSFMRDPKLRAAAREVEQAARETPPNAPGSPPPPSESP
ncbi:Integral membrane protein [Enhygromyxa salina]|uniref:Integral membrane protein n=1 Tax=Enhygromyxa salina TaxID=215803 RepID=A0A0C2CYD1_9BACT|nr:lysylphosphatidylglycerol synthase transmembrane domain-containing protein [Enhygromyxa salina]KIG12842.1 Integral membrane protein [Enhygromyxa salina]